MPKIRGFKSDLWTDEDFVELSPYARLLWMGMWNYACDNGHLADKSKQIKMRVLPTDDVNCAELLRELEQNRRIVRESGVITIPNFTKHQKPDKRYFQTCDVPGCTKPTGDSQPETRGANNEPRSALPTGTESPHDEVNRSEVKGSDGEGGGATRTKPSSDKSDAEFEKFWTHYPRKIAKGSARKAWTTAAKKVDADTIINAARSFAVRSAGADPKFIPHATTWLNGERWADEVDAEKGESGGDWFQPFTPGEAPPDVADDPEKYAAWLEGQRAAWRRAGNR